MRFLPGPNINQAKIAYCVGARNWVVSSLLKRILPTSARDDQALMKATQPRCRLARFCFALFSLLSFRVRSRGPLELELVTLRHQVIVLKRQRDCGRFYRTAAMRSSMPPGDGDKELGARLGVRLRPALFLSITILGKRLGHVERMSNQQIRAGVIESLNYESMRVICGGVRSGSLEARTKPQFAGRCGWKEFIAATLCSIQVD
jgi:hypothetical protein